MVATDERSREGIRLTKPLYAIPGTRKRRSERPKFKGVSIRSMNGAPSRKGCVVNGQMTTVSHATNECAPPIPPLLLRPCSCSFILFSYLLPPPLPYPCSVTSRTKAELLDQQSAQIQELRRKHEEAQVAVAEEAQVDDSDEDSEEEMDKDDTSDKAGMVKTLQKVTYQCQNIVGGMDGTTWAGNATKQQINV